MRFVIDTVGMIKLEVTRICAHHLFKISTHLRHETRVGKIQKREQKLINNLKITKPFLEAFKNEEAASKEGTQISIHKTKLLLKKLQITGRKLSNNTQRCEHQIQAHNAANETYKNSQVIKTQTRYTQGTVWQEFCSSDSDNIGNNDSDNDI